MRPELTPLIKNQGYIEIGGLQSLVDKFSYAISPTTLFSNTTCGLPPSDYFNLYRAADRDFPWPGFLILLYILTLALYVQIINLNKTYRDVFRSYDFSSLVLVL